MQRLVSVPIVGRGFDLPAQRQPVRAHSLDRRPQVSLRIIQGGTACTWHFWWIGQLFREYLADCHDTARSRCPSHPIERGLEAVKRERGANTHHNIEARRL